MTTTTQPLTPRQREVYGLYRLGLNYREIAERLFIEPHTAKNHMWEARKALGTRVSGYRRLGSLPPATATLTPRQRDVCALAQTGYSNRQIARRLGLSEYTVRNVLYNARKRYANAEAGR